MNSTEPSNSEIRLVTEKVSFGAIRRLCGASRCDYFVNHGVHCSLMHRSDPDINDNFQGQRVFLGSCRLARVNGKDGVIEANFARGGIGEFTPNG